MVEVDEDTYFGDTIRESGKNTVTLKTEFQQELLQLQTFSTLLNLYHLKIIQLKLR